ncbi:class I tRNA ligase family protein [Mycoplasmopsis lipophila]|uniref:class I tRNA ligase family protein n=1 Tax=Mycoplasmopsis lipophila TaxID=2117 RepID=UPI003873AEFC
MIKIYVCGPTVYNSIHIGNIRPIVTIDLMLKAARWLNIDFKFIHNITDIDDKIILEAKKQNIPEEQLSKKYADEYIEILQLLNVDTITNLEYVTKNLDVIKSFIKKLIDLKKAYKDKENNVWFDIQTSLKEYGKISNRKLDEMIFEEENSKLKKHPADFALWKNTNIGIKFDSEFGMGRPGWHTECVALINKVFKGETIDFHGGGIDLTFPHHENENIQHYAVNGKSLTKKWIRTGQINLNNIKMSKSLGNVILAKNFLSNEHYADYYKLFILNSKFSSPINFNDEFMNNITKIYKKYKKAYFKISTFFYKKNNLKINKNIVNKTLNELFNDIYSLNFSDFNYKFNEIIKNINKEENIDNYEIFKTITKVFHFDFTNDLYLNKYLDIFDKWAYFIDKKEYSEADKLRQELIENDLI